MGTNYKQTNWNDNSQHMPPCPEQPLLTRTAILVIWMSELQFKCVIFLFWVLGLRFFHFADVCFSSPSCAPCPVRLPTSVIALSTPLCSTVLSPPFLSLCITPVFPPFTVWVCRRLLFLSSCLFLIPIFLFKYTSAGLNPPSFMLSTASQLRQNLPHMWWARLSVSSISYKQDSKTLQKSAGDYSFWSHPL